MDPRIQRLITFVTANPRVGLLPDVEDLPALKRLGESSDCVSVWNAIERRLDVATTLHRDRLVQTFGETIERAEEVAATSFGEEIWRLMGAIRDAMREQSFLETALPSQRKKLATDVSRAASKLVEGIAMLRNSDEGRELARELDSALRGYAQQTRKRGLSDIQGWTGEGWSEYAEAAKSPGVQAICELVLDAAVADPEEIIKTIVRGVDEWSHVAPMIPKPADPNADRLRMIRVLTAHFVRRYGSPLRQQVLAIAGVFYDCRDLAESDITKLAPARSFEKHAS